MSVCLYCKAFLLKLIQLKEAIVFAKGFAEHVPYYLCPFCRKEIEGISSLKEAREFLKKPPHSQAKVVRK